MNTEVRTTKEDTKHKRETAAIIKKLRKGLHVFIVAQNKGGECKSILILEAFLAALYSGLKAIVATLDQSNKTLAVALGDEKKIISVDVGSAARLQRQLNDLFDFVESEQALLLIDVPPAFVDENHPMIPAMKKTRIFDGENSIAALIPVRPKPDAIIGAVDAFNVMPIEFKRGLIRAWHHDPDAPQWDEFPAFMEMAKKYPVWNVGTWLPTTEHIIHKHGDFSKFPNIDVLDAYYQENAFNHSRYERNAMLNTLEHFEDARRHIFKHLIAPLLEPEK